MRDYNYLQAMYMSFYSRKLYRDVANNWGGGVVLYLFFLLAICWAVMMFKIQPVVNAGAVELADTVVTQMPEVVIKDGKLSTPESRPYFINASDDKKHVFIIDTSGQYQNMDNVPENVQILVTQDKIYYYEGSKHTDLRMREIPKSTNITLAPEKVKQYLKDTARWLWVVILPFCLVFSLVYRLIQSLVYALLGMIFVGMSRVMLSYSQVLKLSMIAVTPAIVLGEIFDLCGVVFNFQGLLLFLIAMGYLFFAIKSNKHTEMVVQ